MLPRSEIISHKLTYNVRDYIIVSVDMIIEIGVLLQTDCRLHDN